MRTLTQRPEVEELQRRYPGVTVWFGEATGHWWCLPPAHWKNPTGLEAATPQQLDLMIRSALGWR